MALSKFAPKITGVNSNRWTLWVSMDIRCQFDQQKALLMPSRTHGSFVEFLLSYRNFLDSKGELPPFFCIKKPYSKSSTSNSLPPMISSSGTLNSSSENANQSTHCWSYSSPELRPEPKVYPSPLIMATSWDSPYLTTPRTSTNVALFDGAIYDNSQLQFEPEYYLASDGSFYHSSQYSLYQEPEYYTPHEMVSPDVVAAVSIADYHHDTMGCY